jgi:ABC-type phosphate transport system permease subunit
LLGNINIIHRQSGTALGATKQWTLRKVVTLRSNTANQNPNERQFINA